MDRLTKAFLASSVAAGMSALCMVIVMIMASSPGFALDKRKAELDAKRQVGEISASLDTPLIMQS